jgi:hypothetical protein
MSAASIVMELNELERESREQTDKIEEKEVQVEDSSLRTKKRTAPDLKNGSLAEMDYSSTKEYLKADEFGDAVFISKCDASDELPQDNPTYIQKSPQTLSNRSIVLNGNGQIELEQYSQKS